MLVVKLIDNVPGWVGIWIVLDLQESQRSFPKTTCPSCQASTAAAARNLQRLEAWAAPAQLHTPAARRQYLEEGSCAKPAAAEHR